MTLNSTKHTTTIDNIINTLSSCLYAESELKIIFQTFKLWTSDNITVQIVDTSDLKLPDGYLLIHFPDLFLNSYLLLVKLHDDISELGVNKSIFTLFSSTDNVTFANIGTLCGLNNNLNGIKRLYKQHNAILDNVILKSLSAND